MRKIILIVTAIIVTATASPAHAARPDIERVAAPSIMEKRIKAVEARISTMVRTPGPAGDRGPQGATGATGANGRDGRDGLSVSGPAGPKGDKGESITGPIGLTGETGATGPAGNDGLPGRDGQGLPSGTILLIGGDCPAGTSVQGTSYQWRVYQGNPFTGTGSELWVSACRVN